MVIRQFRGGRSLKIKVLLTLIVWKRFVKVHGIVKAIPRHKVLIWKMINDALPVRSNLDKRGIGCYMLCPRCDARIETIDHIFKECALSIRVWFGSQLSINFSEANNIDFRIRLIHNIQGSDSNIIAYIASITYNIPENRIIPEEWIIQIADLGFVEFQNTNAMSLREDHGRASRPHLMPHRNSMLRWLRPDLGFIKINCYSNLQIMGKCGLGVICRNEEGLAMVSAMWEMYGFNCATTTEVYEIFMAIKLAVECGFMKVIMESDSEKVINLLKEDTKKDITYLHNLVLAIH